MTARARSTQGKAQRNLKDYLSHLTLRQAERLLGSQGRQLLVEGGKLEVVSTDDVRLTDDFFLLRHQVAGAQVTIRLNDARGDRLELSCDVCGREPCAHKGTALSFILEEKTLLGLAAPPPERVPVDALNEGELVAQAVAERRERAEKEKMQARALDPSTPWTDYTVMSKASGKTYRVALRGWEVRNDRKLWMRAVGTPFEVRSWVRQRFAARCRPRR